MFRLTHRNHTWLSIAVLAKNLKSDSKKTYRDLGKTDIAGFSLFGHFRGPVADVDLRKAIRRKRLPQPVSVLLDRSVLWPIPGLRLHNRGSERLPHMVVLKKFHNDRSTVRHPVWAVVVINLQEIHPQHHASSVHSKDLGVLVTQSCPDLGALEIRALPFGTASCTPFNSNRHRLKLLELMVTTNVGRQANKPEGVRSKIAVLVTVNLHHDMDNMAMGKSYLFLKLFWDCYVEG